MIRKSVAPRRSAQIPLCLAIAMALGSTATIASAPGGVSASIGQARVLVPSDAATSAEQAGAQLLHDYGAFRLYRVDAARLSSLQGNGMAPELTANTIEFNTVSLDTTGAPPDVPAAFRASAGDGPSLRVVQFPGPIAREWVDALQRTGAHIVQYIPNNAYVVLADAGVARTLDDKAARGEDLQYSGPYEPYYKLGSTLAERVNSLSAARKIPLTVQVVSWDGNAATKAAIERLAGKQGGWQDLSGVEALTFDATEGDIATLAKMRDVFAVEEHLEPHKMDERQAQILAGNFSPNYAQPSGPGYLAWMASLGFPTDPAEYPVVDVVDDGLGNGSAVNGAGDRILTKDGDGVTTRVLNVRNCSADANGDGKAGHGHLNTGVVGGYDLRVNSPFVDPLGYQRGLGINPYARLAHTKVFRNSGSWSTTKCSSNDSVADLVQKQLDDGAAISSNSWGANSNTYNAEARSYDIATRDSGSAAGNQPLVFIFAAGNAGPSASSVGTPATAKNVITVGASENYRPTDESGNWNDSVCGTGPTDADNAMDASDYSSRGPAKGSRTKPEVIAPGTHVQSTASTDPTYDGTGVCDKYRPLNQTIFAGSTGTSHATPAVSGMASLVYYWLRTHYADNAPSAAMIKAYFMAHPIYLTGTYANDTLPSNVQGYGMPNLGVAFDTSTQRLVSDQEHVLTGTGQTWTWSGIVADPAKPLRITMAYSDAPGATTGNPQVNNLDLKVVVNGVTYLGNRFSGQWSTTGGSADANNNYEAVFLPPGTTGNVDITVTATNIAGDGVPNSGTTTDQDFALVCANCTAPSGDNHPPVATDDSYSTDEDTALTVAAPGVLANDSDPDGDTLSASVVANPAHGTLVLSANGGFTYTPASHYYGSDSFTYRAGDGHGGTSDVATVNLTVNHVNHAPVAVDDSYTTTQDAALVIPAPGVLGNDTDADGDTLTAAVGSNPAHGTLVLNASGGFTYTPASGYAGPDSFTYTANDGQTSSAAATVSLTVTGINHAPVAVDDAIVVNQGGTATTLVGGATSVLANDTDADGDTLTATLQVGTTKGTIALAADGTFTYQNNGSSATSDKFIYRACDAHNACSNAQVNITINLNPTLSCSPRDQVVRVGDNVSLPLGTLFADPEGQALTFQASGAPASLTLDPATGVLSGTPVAGDVTASPYTVNVTAQDSDGASTQASLTLTVVDAGDEVFKDGFDGAVAAGVCQ